MPRVLKNALMLSHDILNEVVGKGDVVVDATCGKGVDTVFLSKLVGENGKVYSFDIQEIAIDIAKKNVVTSGCSDNVEFVLDGHEKARGLVPSIGSSPLNAGIAAGVLLHTKPIMPSLDINSA